ncbi:hypothetical protein GYMLUDRAFT_32899 [Collybiopsis luxurians FD-317 M1]|nr:hypothetical protein GYMLUDRAFT_32899 [Collybiopsis luxurians FD-317 M1]
MVPFWIRGVQAAERGQVLRLEEFLDSLETESWPPRGPDVWAHPDRHSNYGGRPLNTWDTAWNNDVKKWADSVSAASAESGRTTPNKRSVTPQPCSPQSVRDPHSLVEVVARRNAVSENRKLEMYSFLELPTNEKVKRIDDLIRSLRSS